MARKVKMKLNQLYDAEAQFVSVVGKGANRQPIKIMKSDEGEQTMDWTKLFHNADRVMKAEISPEILAIAAAPGTDLEVLTEQLNQAELNTGDVRKMETEDGQTITFYVQKTDVDLGEGGDHQAVYQIADGISAICLVAQKAFQPWAGSESFGENMQAQGFFPGLHVAQDVLQDTIFEISMKAMSPSDMAEKIKKATEEFSSAIQSMAVALPQSVFKFEDIVRKGSTTGGPAPGEDPTVGNGDRGEPTGDTLSNEKGAKSSIEPMGSVQKEETDPGSNADADQTEGEKKKGKKKDGEEGTDDTEASAEGDGSETTAKEDPLAEIKGLISGLSTALNEGLAGVQKQVTDLESQVSEAKQVATKADEATRGRVSAAAPEDDGLTVQKGASFGAGIPLIDTASGSID